MLQLKNYILHIIKTYPNILLVTIIVFGGINIFAQNSDSIINTSHLDYLYEKINVRGNEMGIIHIYADYPDYKYVEAKGEGIACVDDAARAEVFYIKYYSLVKNTEALEKIKNLTRFLIYMQASNGFFYNFIWSDYSIDSTYKTSVAEPNWWSWRAIWALSEAQKFFKKADPQFAVTISPNLVKAVKASHKWLDNNFSGIKENFGGFELPGMLPYKYAADQAAILVKAFTVYYELTGDEDIKHDIMKMCSGIIAMQTESKKDPPYAAFLSWQNTWHAWGNSQADALIDAGRTLHIKKYFLHALKEINLFYPYLIKENYINDFTVIKKDMSLKMSDIKKYSQIAYGIRPMVFASLNAYKVTHNKKYALLAAKLAGWFFGNNTAGINMYNPETGICYDGITGKEEVNKNSGAESTIEALLSLIELENNPLSKEKIIKKYLPKKSDFK